MGSRSVFAVINSVGACTIEKQRGKNPYVAVSVIMPLLANWNRRFPKKEEKLRVRISPRVPLKFILSMCGDKWTSTSFGN